MDRWGNDESDKLSPAKIAEYRQTFDFFDRSKDGLISKDELMDVMNAFFRYPTEEQVEQMIAHYDKNGKGGIDFKSFLRIFHEKSESERTNYETIQQQFNAFDIDGDGYISQTDMHLSFLSLGKELTPQEVGEIVKMADFDGDGRLSFEEFYNIMSTHV